MPGIGDVLFFLKCIHHARLSALEMKVRRLAKSIRHSLARSPCYLCCAGSPNKLSLCDVASAYLTSHPYRYESELNGVYVLGLSYLWTIENSILNYIMQLNQGLFVKEYVVY